MNNQAQSSVFYNTLSTNNQWPSTTGSSARKTSFISDFGIPNLTGLGPGDQPNTPHNPHETSKPNGTSWKAVGNSVHSRKLGSASSDTEESSDAFLKARTGRTRAMSSPAPFLSSGPPGLVAIEPIYEDENSMEAWKPWDPKNIWNAGATPNSNNHHLTSRDFGAAMLREGSEGLVYVEEGMERTAEAFTQNILEVDDSARNRTRSKSSSASFYSADAYANSIWGVANSSLVNPIRPAPISVSHRRSSTG